MKKVNSKDICNIFKALNSEKIEYILIRNINNELPKSLIIGKDIDILIKKENKQKTLSFFKNENYHVAPHPHKNNIYLYNIDKFIYLQNKHNRIIFDLQFKLVVRSLDAGQWVPLDNRIQESAWINRRFKKIDDEFGYWTLSYDNELIMLITRCIFDKRKFQKGYIKRINELKLKTDLNGVEKKMKLIFFKYAKYLLEHIKNNNYNQIIENYIQFKEY
jgi:hypothetical protein